MLPRPIAVPPALRCPKKSSHYSFARFFRPLRILRLASSATGGARLRIPIPRDPLGNSGISPYGGASLIKSLISTATAGVALLSRQKCPKATWGKPQDPDAPERPPGKPKGGFPDRGLNGAYKVSQMHLPPPNLPRFGGGERPPFSCKPPAPLTITMGQRLGSLRVTD